MVINQEYIAVYYVYNIHTYYVCICMSKGKVTFLCKIIFDEMSTFNHLPFHCDVKKVNQIWYLANATCIYHYMYMYLSLHLLDTKFCCLLICKMVEWISIKGKCLIKLYFAGKGLFLYLSMSIFIIIMIIIIMTTELTKMERRMIMSSSTLNYWRKKISEHNK